MLQKKDSLTQQPGWRQNPVLTIQIKNTKKICNEMKNEIKTRKIELNKKEEQMLGTNKYCQNLEDRKAANEWLMKSCPEWQGVLPSKQRFWNARIRSLRKKVNVGGINVYKGYIPKVSCILSFFFNTYYCNYKLNQKKTDIFFSLVLFRNCISSTFPFLNLNKTNVKNIQKLQKKKKKLQESSFKTLESYYRLKQWSMQLEVLKNTLKNSNVLLERTMTGHNTMGPEHELTLDETKRNNIQLKMCKKSIKDIKLHLENHRSLIDTESNLPMHLAYNEIQRTMALEKIANHDSIVRINILLQKATIKVNDIRTYRQNKFKKKLKYVRAMHGMQETIVDATVIVSAPCLVSAPDVFWPQDLNHKSIDSPSTTMLLRWQDPVDPDELIEGYRLVVYKGGAGGGENKPDNDTSGNATADTDTHFEIDRSISRDTIFLDDDSLIHENDHKNGEGGYGSGSVGSLMDAATGEYYNILRVQHLDPNREYKFTVATLTSLEMQTLKKKKAANYFAGSSDKKKKKQKEKERKKKEKEKEKRKKEKRKNSKKKDIRQSYVYEASRPSPLTGSKATCADYPAPIEAPSIESFIEVDGTSTFGYMIRWKRPKEYGIEIEGYKIEMKNISKPSKTTKKNDKTQKQNKKSPIASTKYDVEEEEKKQGNRKKEEQKIKEDRRRSISTEQILLDNEKKFGSDVAGMWKCIQTIPQDLDSTYFSKKLRCGAMNSTYLLKINQKYKFRINSFARNENNDTNNSSSYLFQTMGIPTKDCIKTEPPKGSKNQRKSYIQRANEMETKKREAEVNKAMHSSITKQQKKRTHSKKTNNNNNSNNNSSNNNNNNNAINALINANNNQKSNKKRIARGSMPETQTTTKVTKKNFNRKQGTRQSMVELPSITKNKKLSFEHERATSDLSITSVNTFRSDIPLFTKTEEPPLVPQSKEEKRQSKSFRLKTNTATSTKEKEKKKKKPKNRFSMLMSAAVDDTKGKAKAKNGMYGLG